MVKKQFVAATVAVFVLGVPSVFAADDPKPEAPPAPPGQPAAGAKDIEQIKKDVEDLRRRLANGVNQADQNGGGPGGQGGGRGQRGGGRGFMGPMMNQIAGVDVENPKAAGREDKLPLGGEKHFVLNVPVGGIDQIGVQGNFGQPSAGSWKVEELFKLTDEQTKAVEALRTEYAAEKKKLEDEILAQQTILAEKAKKLRLTYEQRANDVLTGGDKEAKQKIDAVESDTGKQIEALVVEGTANLENNNDPQALFTAARALRDKVTPVVADARKKMVELIPAETRAKVQDVFTQDEAAQQKRNEFMQKMRNRGAQGDTVKPPEKEKSDF